MVFRLKNIWLLVLIITFFYSCQSTRHFGDRGSRFSKDRLAQMTEKDKRSRRYDPRREDVQMARPSEETAKPIANKENIYTIDKVEFHAERTQILRKAQSYIGIPYAYGGKNPSQGFDCSGFVGYVFKENKIDLGGGSAQSMAEMGKHKDPLQLNAGDLVFFGEGNKISHVGIITMNDDKNLTMVHSSTSAGITNDNITYSDYWRTRLLFGIDAITAHFEGNLGMK